GLVQDNIVFNVKGAGIVTEDGSETQNVIDHNFVVRSENATSLTVVDGGINADPLGRRGNGFWFRSPGNVVRNNVVADTREGFGWYTGASEFTQPSTSGFGPDVLVNLPNYACADTTVTGQYTTKQIFQIPNLDISQNEAYSTSEFGL